MSAVGNSSMGSRYDPSAHLLERSFVSDLGGMDVGVFLYYLAFALYSVGALILFTSLANTGFSFVYTFSTLAKYGSFAILAMKVVLFDKLAPSRLAIAAALSLVGLASYAGSHEPTILALVLFVVAAKGVEAKGLARITLCVCLLVTSIALVGSASGILDDLTMARDGVVGARSSMGFDHPNHLGLTIASLCVALFALRGEKIGAPEAFVAVACCLFIYSVSDSRTAVMGIIVGYAVFFVLAHVKGTKAKRLIGLALSAVIVATVVLSLYFMVCYDSSKMIDSVLNEALSARLSLAHRYFVLYQPGVFGQDTSLLPVVSMYNGNWSSTFVVDNAYARLYIRYGPVCAAVVLGLLAAYLLEANRRASYGIVFAGVAFAAVYGFSEHMFIRPELNYFMVVAFSQLLYGVPSREKVAEPERVPRR